MSRKFDFSISEPKKSAKTILFNIGVKTLYACGAPKQISFLGFSYDIVNKLREEVNKLSEEKANEALEAIRRELNDS